MIRKSIATIAVLAIVTFGVLFAIRQNKPALTNEGLHVTASYYPLYDFARQVGGSFVTVTNMTPAGAEPHDFEPTAQALARAHDAPVFLYSGASLEPWAPKFVGGYKGTVIKADTGLKLRSGQDEDGHQAVDPHFWLDPVLAQQIVDTIADGLSRADPSHGQQYQHNALVYKQKLIQLDKAYQEGLRQCGQRTIIVSHQSMGYVASRYHLNVEAVAGLSPDSEPSAARLAELASIVKREGIQYVFFESLVSPRLADTIAKETGAKTLVLDPIEGLTNEAQKAGSSYVSLQYQNLANLRRALACQ